jgi:hypothetical protein
VLQLGSAVLVLFGLLLPGIWFLCSAASAPQVLSTKKARIDMSTNAMPYNKAQRGSVAAVRKYFATMLPSTTVSLFWIVGEKPVEDIQQDCFHS